MKMLYKIFVLLFIWIFFSCAAQQQVSSSQGYTGNQFFYDQLSPYGQWVDFPNYNYVWIPDVGPGFSPYSTNGSWVMTKYGWTWVSEYNWGWAAFHYGRWDYDNYYGWFWVPGNEWGPSWVNWRRADGYYGWSPMRPGISVNQSFDNGFRDAGHWNFVRDIYFGRSDIGQYYIDRTDNDRIMRNSAVINNTYFDNRSNSTYVAGPSRNDVQIMTGRRIRSVPVRKIDRPGEILNNNQLWIYRPQIERTSDGSLRPAPSKVTKPEEFRTVRERSDADRRNIVTPMENDRRGDQQKEQQLQPTDSRRQEQLQQEQKQQQQNVEGRRQRESQQQIDRRGQEQQQQEAQPRPQTRQQRQKVVDPAVTKRRSK